MKLKGPGTNALVDPALSHPTLKTWGLSGNSVWKCATQCCCLSMDNRTVHFLVLAVVLLLTYSMAMRQCLLQRARVCCLSSPDIHSSSLIFWFQLLAMTDKFSSFSFEQNQGLNGHNGLMNNPANLFNLFLHTDQQPIYSGFVHLCFVRRLGKNKYHLLYCMIEDVSLFN